MIVSKIHKNKLQKTALVTGATRGIGYETTRILLENGYQVFFCARDELAVRGTENELSGLGMISGIVADVTHYEDVVHLVKYIHEQVGTIDVLVNNVGSNKEKRFTELSHKDIDVLIDSNLISTLSVTHEVLSHCMDRGVVINVASITGVCGYRNSVVYSSAKFGVIGFTEALSKEYAADDLQVYAVCPYKVQNQKLERVNDLLPETVAHTILDLCNKTTAPIKSGEYIVIS